MPFADPAALDLKALFRDAGMFSSRRTWAAAGFRVLDRPHNGKIMVAAHPSVPGLFFKKYSSDMGQSDQRKNYERRLAGATRLRAFVAVSGLQHIVVPRKWLFELPRVLSPKEPSHVLVVEQLDLMNDVQTKDAYHRIDPNSLRELCSVLFHFRGMDSNTKNVPFMADGRIALIDTEHWDRGSSKSYLHYVGEHLASDRRKIAKRIFKDLGDNSDFSDEDDTSSDSSSS